MTKERYVRITEMTRHFLSRLPGGERLLKLPTFLCALIYLEVLCWLAGNRDDRFIRAALVPAVSFLAVTLLRPLIHRQRPYDRFGVPPVGKWEPGKGKSMPSRHTVCAVAIAMAVMYVFPKPAVCIGMTLLGAGIAVLRVLSGQHYPSDVAAAIALAVVIALIGYGV